MPPLSARARISLRKATERCGTCEDRAPWTRSTSTCFSVVVDGRPPTTAETAAALDLAEPEIAAAYRRLHDAHALVLFPGAVEIWMAHPFCFAPTPHRVTAGGRTWTGTCAWDALGIPGALHGDGQVESACACCGDPLSLAVEDGELVRGADVLVHFLVPAGRWWEDIGFT